MVMGYLDKKNNPRNATKNLCIDYYTDSRLYAVLDYIDKVNTEIQLAISRDLFLVDPCSAPYIPSFPIDSYLWAI